MFRSLWTRFFSVLIIVAIVGLSAAFLLKELMILDFGEYQEGERIDRVYWITAALEGSYAKFSGWNREDLIDNMVWGLMLGIEAVLFDDSGNKVIDTREAIEELPELVKKRVLTISEGSLRNAAGSFVPYDMFLGGREIGRIEVKIVGPGKEEVFIRRANRFLMFTVLALGGSALLISIFFARALTKPINDLTSAAGNIAEGNLGSRVGTTGRDEISRLSATFNRMAEKLETQESLRKKLTANIAHELRTPLSAMRGEMEGMLDGYIPMNRESIQSLHDEIGRLRHILEGIEELSRAEASSLTLTRQRIPMRPFLENIIQRYQGVFHDKGVSLVLECDGGTELHADPDRLGQIMINLISNALKATGPGGTVNVRARQEGGSVRIDVEDTGIGIPAEDLPYVFERFYRRTEGGLGLGLAIVKELVEAHNGDISVRSTPGKGSLFSVSF